MTEPKLKPGEVYVAGEPEYIGDLPIRTEITVLPADDPNMKSLGFVIREYNGTEVFKADGDGVPLITKDALKVGDQVLVTTLVGILLMTVVEREDGLYAKTSGGTIADLQFDTDDRHCWVSTYAINGRSLKQLTIKT